LPKREFAAGVAEASKMAITFDKEMFDWLKSVNLDDEKAVCEFRDKFGLSDDQIKEMQSIKVPNARALQDYRGTYNDIREWLRKEKAGEEKPKKRRVTRKKKEEGEE